MITKRLLEKFRNTLHTNGIENRIVTENADDRWWPYGTAPERIAYLAEARNRALKPLQSDDATIRLEGYDKFDKVIFLNDILFSWQSIVRLLATRIDGGDVSSPTEYDLACAMDYSAHGRSES